MQQEIFQELHDSAGVVLLVAERLLPEIEAAARALTRCYESRGKLLVCGNGGSAADAQHIAGEFVGRYKRDRAAARALALSADGALLTAIGNDYGYEQTFARQVEAWADAGDVLIALSTSGASPNVLAAVATARRLDVTVIAFTGRNGVALASMCDIALIVPSDDTPRIQEAHITIAHVLCGIVEREL